MSEHPPVCSDPECGVCALWRARAAFAGAPNDEQEGAAMTVSVTCPRCAHEFVPEAPVRVTEATAAKPAAKGKPFGDVEYADPGWQKDGKSRYPLDTDKHVRAAWSYINQPDNAALYKARQLQQIKAKIKAAAKKLGIAIADKAAEAWINGGMSFSDLQELVRAAVRTRLAAASPEGYVWVWIVDMSATDVVYCVESSEPGDDLFQCTYTVTLTDAGASVELGDAVEVVRTYLPVPAGQDVDGDEAEDEAEQPAETITTTEARESIPGRVLEAKGQDAGGNRIFRVRVIAYGDSKNGRRYPEAVMRAAAPLYEGAKIYDHHRTDAELASSTIAGMVGYLRNAEASGEGIEADAVLLPSAAQAAEALDATLAAQADGLAPLVGFSHDVMATYKPTVEGAVRLQEATSIVKVNSADIVADPAAGGQATRMVAGGTGTPDTPSATVAGRESMKESTVAPTTADVLAALKDATPEMLSAVGLSKVGAAPAGTNTTEATTAASGGGEAEGLAKTSFMGKLLIKGKVEDAGLPVAAVEAVTGALPDRITESDVDAYIASVKGALAVVERAELAPTHTAVVTQESRQKKIDALDAFFAGDYSKGYRSFKEAFVDFTGARPRSFDEDFNRTVLKESFGAGYAGSSRGRESMDSTTWNLALGDSITRRMVAEYQQPNLQTWRSVVSSMPPVNDFRTQRIERVGGYGTLPVVGQGAPYQPLTSPGNEEATYAINKKGGTEDITLEMIANDDIRAIARIPSKLGLAAAQTLYRFVWDIFVANAPTSYDNTALFHATHANTDTNALSQSNLSAGRAKMRKQAAYGDTSDILSLVPKTLIVPTALEELAYQLTTSAVAVPATPAGPSDTPNINRGTSYVVVDYWSSATGWFLTADPTLCPTIEVGFYQGRQDPELFTQADQTVGSVFNADKVTYKIRHIYSGTVIDHRGLYRGNA